MMRRRFFFRKDSFSRRRGKERKHLIDGELNRLNKAASTIKKQMTTVSKLLGLSLVQMQLGMQICRLLLLVAAVRKKLKFPCRGIGAIQFS